MNSKVDMFFLFESGNFTVDFFKMVKDDMHFLPSSLTTENNLKCATKSDLQKFFEKKSCNRPCFIPQFSTAKNLLLCSDDHLVVEGDPKPGQLFICVF